MKKKNKPIPVFETLKQIEEDGSEYWYSADMMKSLGYKSLDLFTRVFEKSRQQLAENRFSSKEHFRPLKNSGDARDYHLSRLACYLIVLNADSGYKPVADALVYFAVQMIREKSAEEQFFELMAEQERHRAQIRQEIKKQTKKLVRLAGRAGIKTHKDLAHFHDEGYRGLYDGLNARDIQNLKNLKKSQHILDHMGISELSANLFKIHQTIKQLEDQQITDPARAVAIYRKTGEKIRKAMRRLSGEYPEMLHSFGKVSMTDLDANLKETSHARS